MSPFPAMTQPPPPAGAPPAKAQPPPPAGAPPADAPDDLPGHGQMLRVMQRPPGVPLGAPVLNWPGVPTAGGGSSHLHPPPPPRTMHGPAELPLFTKAPPQPPPPSLEPAPTWMPPLPSSNTEAFLAPPLPPPPALNPPPSSLPPPVCNNLPRQPPGVFFGPSIAWDPSGISTMPSRNCPQVANAPILKAPPLPKAPMLKAPPLNISPMVIHNSPPPPTGPPPAGPPPPPYPPVEVVLGLQAHVVELRAAVAELQARIAQLQAQADAAKAEHDEAKAGSHAYTVMYVTIVHACVSLFTSRR